MKRAFLILWIAAGVGCQEHPPSHTEEYRARQYKADKAKAGVAPKASPAAEAGESPAPKFFDQPVH